MSVKYKHHPIAEIFPMISEDAFAKLKADIEQNGLKDWGLLFEGKILDGRNRYRAASELGIEMTWSEVELGEPDEIAAFDPVAYVLSTNLHRRHLKQSQRAMIAAKMATLKHGQRKTGDTQNCVSQDEASELLSVKKRSVQSAKHVIEHGSKELIAAVEAEAITVSMAEKLCKACDDKREQSRLVKEGREAINMFLKPPVVVDKEYEEDSKEPRPVPKNPNACVKAFVETKDKVETLRVLMQVLKPHELSIVKEWISSGMFEASE